MLMIINYSYMFDLKRFRLDNKMSQNAVANYFGCDQSFISQIERGIRPMPDGYMSKIEADKSVIVYDFNINNNISTVQNQILIPLIPISAQGGTLTDFTMAIKDYDTEKIISPIKGADFAITVTGDSMAPEFPNGCQILLKKINCDSFIEWGRVYVLDTNNGVVIKIINEIEECPELLCTSMNADQTRYAPFKVPKPDILGMYRVLMCMSMK